MNAKNRAVSVNEMKLVWIEERLTAVNEYLEAIQKRLPREIETLGEPRDATMRKVWAVARCLEILAEEVHDLHADLQKGVGWRPAIRSEVRAWMR
jgi:hypothetical protein